MDIIKKFEPFFGEWHVESFIGAGSFGRVYKIYRDELNNRFYSALKYISLPAEESEVKQLRADGMDDDSISTYYCSLAQNLSSEITLMNRLKGNTNIISFEDSRVIPKPNGVGYDIFIRMELLESLTNRIVEKPLTVEQVVQLGMNICSALMLCAKNGIIHRDIKPDNIFISPNGDFKLGDFGIARQLEKTATFMSKKGTYSYMAPEVYKGEKYGATCDIYSLGLVMYRLLNNSRLPFLPAAPAPINPEDRERAIILRMKGEPFPAPCGADPELSRIIFKACAFMPEQRYSDAEEMYRDLFIYSIGGYQPAVSNNPPVPSNTASPVVGQVRTSNQTGHQAPVSSVSQTAAPNTERPQVLQTPQAVPPKTSQTGAPGRTQFVSDDVSETEELKKLISYFSQKIGKFGAYDQLIKEVAEKPKNNPLFLILGIAATVIGIAFVAGSDYSVAATIAGTVAFLISPAMVLLYIFRNRAKRIAYQKNVDTLDHVTDELYHHYLKYGPCCVDPQYSNPTNLSAVLSVILSGKANNVNDAIAYLSALAVQKNHAVVEAYERAVAANAARKNPAKVVFCPGRMFFFR